MYHGSDKIIIGHLYVVAFKMNAVLEMEILSG